MRVLAAFALAIVVAAAASARPAGTAVDDGLIVFASDRAENTNSQIYRVAARGGRRVNVSRSPLAPDEWPEPSPDGSRLLFVSLPTDEPQIWISRADGSGRRRLAHGEDPSWSPDGARVAFVAARMQRLTVVGVDGRRRRTLSRARVWAVEWSPDGRRLAYVEGTLNALHVVGAGGASDRRLGEGLVFGSEPAWSRDGRIAIAAAPADVHGAPAAPYALHLFDAVTGADRTIAVPPARFAERDGSFTIDSPRWSPDGRWIVLVSGEQNTTQTEVDVVGADGSGFRRLTGVDDYARDPAWSPDGRRLALSRRSSIYTIGPGGGAARLVARARPYELLASPAWSPDGRTLFFTGRIATVNQTDLYTIRPDGSRLRRLTGTLAFEYQPRWSPDETRIAYVRARRFQEGYALHLMRADGSGVRLVYRCRTECGWPSWSPDGRRIVFSEGTERPVLKIVPATGGRARAIGAGSAPSWSRPRNQIAFDLGPLSVVDPTGTRRRVILRGGGSNAAWSPGGGSLAFVRTESCDRDCAYGLYVVRLGGRVQRLAGFVSPDTPAWSPDGTRLAYTNDVGDIAVVPRRGGRERILVGGPGSESGPDWRR